jgi:hypothetical protein
MNTSLRLLLGFDAASRTVHERLGSDGDEPRERIPRSRVELP